MMYQQQQQQHRTISSNCIIEILKYVDSWFHLVRFRLINKLFCKLIDEYHGIRGIWAIFSQRMKVGRVLFVGKTYGLSITKLDVSRCNLSADRLKALFQYTPNIEYFKCCQIGTYEMSVFSHPQIKSLEVIDASTMVFKKQALAMIHDPPPFTILRFWQASTRKLVALKRFVSTNLEQLCISNFVHASDNIFRAIINTKPPLQVLVLRNIGTFNIRDLSNALQAIHETLTVLDLSECKYFQSLPLLRFPKLSVIVLDSCTIGDLRFLRYCSKLRILSLSMCSSITDESFLDFDNNSVATRWEELQVLRVPGTRISEVFLKECELLSQIKYISVDSCRDISREYRLTIRRRYEQVTLEEIAPELYLNYNAYNK